MPITFIFLLQNMKPGRSGTTYTCAQNVWHGWHVYEVKSRNKRVRVTTPDGP